MTKWTSDDLDKIGATDELQIAPLRRDGTLTKPVTIWVVRIGDNLYVRSYRGRSGSWFRAVQARHEGRIKAGGVEKDVMFVEEADPVINDQIDTAYRTKYRGYSARYVDPMVAADARATTIKLVRAQPKLRCTNRKVCEFNGTEPIPLRNAENALLARGLFWPFPSPLFTAILS